jgi:D-alanyl-D-alanine carboxypeptidase/D-alanyl-D-alanine-endopeptidase (penicillin-binding protein 4)
MKFSISILILLLTSSAWAQKKPLKEQNHIVNQQLTILKKDTDLKSAAISFLAVDLKTGESIAELNPDMGMIPASTQKLFTTATILELAGADYRFKTKIQYTGTIDKTSKTLNGNIIIKGGGDPTLGSKYFYRDKQFDFIKSIITAIKSSGIEKIAGRVIADATIYDAHAA